MAAVVPFGGLRNFFFGESLVEVARIGAVSSFFGLGMKDAQAIGDALPDTEQTEREDALTESDKAGNPGWSSYGLQLL